MTEREARLLTLIAQAVLIMEMTMREQIDALKAVLAEQAAALDALAGKVDALKASIADTAIRDAEAQAIRDELGQVVESVRASTDKINGMAA